MNTSLLSDPPAYTRAGLERSFEPVSTRRTFEEAVEQIAEKIKSGDLHIGDRLPSERELAAQMRISRPTLREAVKTLAEAGVLEVRRGQSGGIFVGSELVPRELAAHAPGDPRQRGGRRARGAPPARAARRPAGRRARERGRLRRDAATIERQRELAAADDFLRHEDLFLQLDLKFHLAMARATRNSTVVPLMRTCCAGSRSRATWRCTPRSCPTGRSTIHERTLAAIRSADFALIDEVMDEHLAQLEQIWERETGRGLVRPLPDFLQPVAERSRALRSSG